MTGMAGGDLDEGRTTNYGADEIGAMIRAFQINLLALNAGVEAAWAGEAARGSRSWPPKSARWRNDRAKPPSRSAN